MTGTAASDLKAYACGTGATALAATPFYKPITWWHDVLPDAATPLPGRDVPSGDLVRGRLLMAAYEHEFVFLPDDPAGRVSLELWRRHYDRERQYLAHAVRYQLEDEYFRDVRAQVEVTGNWSVRQLEDYFDDYRRNLTCEDTQAIAERIRASRAPQEAARVFAIQLAADFLVESSAMTRNLQGYYGREQSELFKIVIDEFGYGVHETKHSTLYKFLMESIGLDSEPHAYWDFYMPATLLANNYYNMICNNHAYFFNYIGAITQIENAFVVSFAYLKELFDELFDGSADTRYFREHVHIDQHHGRMAFQDLLMSLAQRLDKSFIPEFVRGFEESIYLGVPMKRDVLAHLAWFDALWAQWPPAGGPPPQALAQRSSGILDRRTRLQVESGAVYLQVSPNSAIEVAAGDGFLLPAGLLFALCPLAGARYRLDPAAA